MITSQVLQLFNTVVTGGFCIGCGTCTAVTNSPVTITMDEFGCYQAKLKSIAQGMTTSAPVLNVCPFSDLAPNEDEIAQHYYSQSCKVDSRLGFYLALYAGYVEKSNFRDRGSSGGVGKWILFELFRRGEVDAVIQVRHNPSSNFLYEYSITRSVEEICAGSKSVYYPIEMSSILKYVKENPGRYIISGLPCFIKSLRLLAAEDEVFHQRICFTVGLICGHLKSSRYADMIAWQMGVAPGKLKFIDFRQKIKGRYANEKGVKVTGYTNDGFQISKVDIVQNIFGTNYNLGFFKYRACDYCDDVVAETADITVGDAWLPEYLEDGRGTTVVIVRNSQIQEIIEDAMAVGTLHLEPLSVERVVKSQNAAYRHRRDGLAYRLHLDRKRNMWTPPKRVSPSYKHLTRRRRKIYAFRIKLTEMSHEMFRLAVESGQISLFHEKMDALVNRYFQLYQVYPRFLLHVYRVIKGFISGALSKPSN